MGCPSKCGDWNMYMRRVQNESVEKWSVEKWSVENHINILQCFMHFLFFMHAKLRLNRTKKADGKQER